ncbi:major facilitator superfamily domain-containing protein [Exophiala viscosa]|uniref:major facilitator superfamily domain-containing protein n=1 Tax=Exophiala viscosa TaxID=2486360 RepID=UPI0021A075C2|nr:major facilitator superfamily domain-containing protein [Exophiala viscosa]
MAQDTPVPASEQPRASKESGTEHFELKEKDAADNVHVHNEFAYKGDDSDGKVYWTVRHSVAAVSLAMLYAGSQIMLYFVGGCLSFMEADLGAAKVGSWLPVSNTLAITAVSPFVGYLQDLLGRREITLAGSIVIMVGIALIGSAHSFGQAVTGMTLAGAGAGICELTALAGLSDIVPVRQRGIALALMTASLLPFTPYVIQLLATYVTWRWTQWIALIWNGIVFVGLATTYFPKSHARLEGMSRRQILARIDYLGAILSIVGITLFLVALQSGGYTHPWKSGYVLSQLIIGILLIVAWVVWEGKFAPHPMIPRELYQGQRIVALAFLVACIAGFDFYSLINFFPLAFSTVWSTDPVQVGLKGLGYGISTTVGAVFWNAMLSTKLEARYILLIASVLMTAFTGALAATTPETPKLAVALGTIASFGVGGLLVPAATVALIVVPDALLATTAALSLSIRTVGGSIGFTIYYNIFVNKLTKQLPEQVAKYAIEAGLPAADATEFITTFLTAPANITQAPGFSTKVLAGAELGTRWAYAESLKWVWITSIPFGVLAIITSCFIPSIRKYQTNRVAVAL